MAQEQERKHFFISYTSADRQWAEWIALELEEAGYQTIIQAWDFRPGSNFVIEMDNAAKIAERTIAVLSPAYFESDYTIGEWASAFRRDPRAKQRILLPIRVQPCDVEGLLGSIVYIDLAGKDEQNARSLLLEGVHPERIKPSSVPFPFSQISSETSQEQHPFPGAFPALWNVPFPRNPFFTARTKLLEMMHERLHEPQDKRLPVALHGLGGIGKSQIALEYAYRYRDEYTAVFWVRAESRELLIIDYNYLIKLLNLPEPEVRDETWLLQTVRHWFQTHRNWLLILDNVEDLSPVTPFLPVDDGHIIITTQQEAGRRITSRIKVETLETEESIHFLLRRAQLLLQEQADQATEELHTLARDLIEKLGGHPLALDQAGAYIEETGCTLAEYLKQFAQTKADLLKRRGNTAIDHPSSAETTISLALQKVRRANLASLDLLRFLSFFHPDAIPLEILTNGATLMGPLQPTVSDDKRRNDAIGELLKYSLLQRDSAENTLSLHRLTQLIIQEDMQESTQRRLARRVVEAVNHTTQGDQDAWKERSHLYLPQFQACAVLIKQWEMISSDALAIILRAGTSFMDQTRYSEAEDLFKHALEILYQDTPNPDFATVIMSLSNLGVLYYEKGIYAKAEPCFQCALALCIKVFGTNSINTASSLNNLAGLYSAQGRYKEAEPLYQRALTIREEQLGPEHLETAHSLNNLALLYKMQGRYEEEEPLYQRALTICEEQLGPKDLETARILNNLALLYLAQGRYEEAEPLYQRALTIQEEQLGPEHPDTACSFNNLAGLYDEQGRYEEAEPLYQRALTIREEQLGPEHPEMGRSLNNLAGLYDKQGKYEEAELLYQRALTICEEQLGLDHPETAHSLNNLALLYKMQGRYEEAEPLYGRALAIREERLGPEHPETASSLNNLASLYTAQGRHEEAEPLHQRALTIREKRLGPEHSGTANSLSNLANLYTAQGRYEEAELLYRRALTICEQQLGLEHPHTKRVRESYAYHLAIMRSNVNKGKEMKNVEQDANAPY